jgi:hypothetical protein
MGDALVRSQGKSHINIKHCDINHILSRKYVSVYRQTVILDPGRKSSSSTYMGEIWQNGGVFGDQISRKDFQLIHIEKFFSQALISILIPIIAATTHSPQASNEKPHH